MTNPDRIDPFVSTEEDIEVDAETSAAIQQAIEDANAGRVVTLEQAREQMHQWLSRL